MSENINSEYYQCNDLALATTISLSFPIDSIKWDKDSYKAVFSFINSKQLEQYIERYWRHELQVDPVSYFNQLKNIKTQMYEERR